MRKILFVILFFTLSIAFISCIEKQKSKNKSTENVITKPKGIWIDLILGGSPLPNEFKAIDSLTKKYKINYKRIEMGCEYSNNDILLKEKYKVENSKYFKELEIVLGKNWKQNFDLEKKKLDSLLIRKL